MKSRNCCAGGLIGCIRGLRSAAYVVGAAALTLIAGTTPAVAQARGPESGAVATTLKAPTTSKSVAPGGGGDPFQCPPDGGQCFADNGTPGCDDAGCCAAVCAVDPFCCDTQWDALCADEALLNGACTNVACGPEAGDCLTANGTPGCGISDCCNIVCELDPFCCGTEWDTACVAQASQITVCGGTPIACCLPSGACSQFDLQSCIAAGGQPQGSGSDCATVDCPQPGACCLGDGSCTDVLAQECSIAGGIFQGEGTACFETTCVPFGACCLPTGNCVIEEQILCQLFFGGTYQGDGTACASVNCPQPSCGDPSAGPCFVASTTTGCDNADCCAAVCALDPFCCDTRWDEICAEDALSNPACTSDACGPDAGPCDVANGTPGCEDANCCNTVCGIDAFCCDSEWDQACANLASSLVICGATPSACCLPSGTCFETDATTCNASGGIFMDGTTCADVTCVPFGACCDPVDGSCSVVSNLECDDLGGVYQGNGTDCLTVACPNPTCPGEGSCLDPAGNGTAGCANEECCNLICTMDPFCCSTEWDDICAEAAGQNCLGFVACPWDCTPANADGTFGNGVVNIDDLFLVINSFGLPGGPCDNAPDNGDGTFGNGLINIDDLFGVINNFGSCF